MGKRVIKHGKVLAPLIVGILVLGGISSVAVNVNKVRIEKNKTLRYKTEVAQIGESMVFEPYFDFAINMQEYKILGGKWKLIGRDFNISVKRQKVLSSNYGNDIVADEVFLSSQPSDWKKKHLIEDPKAGDKVYIHWVYSTYGTIGSFHIRIKLYTLDNEKVIDWSYTPDKDFRKDGCTYAVCFLDPWVAPGGYDYQLSEIVDSEDEVEEDDEDNNVASLEFTVSGKNFDIEAYEVYLSSKPEDWKKNYVVNDPHAGDELYIHFRYIIWGVPDKVVNPFSLRIRLVDSDNNDVINVEEEVTKEYRRAGYTYTFYLAREDGGGWIAPGGDYGLGEEVDIDKEVDEWNEDNNLAGMLFSVTPRDEKFDLLAEDVWFSSKASDWDKKHVIMPPFDPDIEIFFHFQWSIVGNPGSVTPFYNIKFVLDGPGGFEFEDTVDEQDYRRANTVVKVCLTDENGNGWFAIPGDYILTCIADSRNDIKEWDEDDNQRKYSFKVSGMVDDDGRLEWGYLAVERYAMPDWTSWLRDLEWDLYINVLDKWMVKTSSTWSKNFGRNNGDGDRIYRKYYTGDKEDCVDGVDLAISMTHGVVEPTWPPFLPRYTVICLEHYGWFTGLWHLQETGVKSADVNRWSRDVEWVVLYSCYILKDPYWRDWARVLDRAHGILGFYDYAHAAVSDLEYFLNLTIENNRPLGESWLKAAKRYDQPGAVVFDSKYQYENDHLWGEGFVCPDEPGVDRDYYYLTTKDI